MQDPIRAVVMAKRLILIVPDGADSLLSILDQYMKEWVSAKAQHALQGHLAQENMLSEAALARTGGSSTDLSGSVATATSGPGAQATSGDGSDNIAVGKDNKSNQGLQSMGKLLRKMSVAKVASQQDQRSEAEIRRLRTAYESQKIRNASHQSQDLPFEMHAIEALLTTVIALETQEFNRVNSQVQVILNYFRSGKQTLLLLLSARRLHCMLVPGYCKLQTAEVREIA
jgi:hypothetical protein